MHVLPLLLIKTNKFGGDFDSVRHRNGAVKRNSRGFLPLVKQKFNPQVYDDFVVRGNTAVLRCLLPTFVREYVSVDSWIRNDGYILKMADTRKTIPSTSKRKILISWQKINAVSGNYELVIREPSLLILLLRVFRDGVLSS
ncbi:ig-like domain-containing protein [Caerostris darwini]|uniref:Ig-like domain-containing protein n=1 Tax=Caerostris darwini TaxID=1538125 RepID=A0AAV4X6Y1_9ARAC|nr:ig-like domain-containing protein [Caerostris darwini]